MKEKIIAYSLCAVILVGVVVLTIAINKDKTEATQSDLAVASGNAISEAVSENTALVTDEPVALDIPTATPVVTEAAIASTAPVVTPVAVVTPRQTLKQIIVEVQQKNR